MSDEKKFDSFGIFEEIHVKTLDTGTTFAILSAASESVESWTRLCL